MAPMKRDIPKQDKPGQEPEPKAKKTKSNNDDDEKTRKHRVVLNPADCDLDFNIEENGLKGSALHEQGFAYCWSGSRANVGITGGKYCFGCKILSAQLVEMEGTPPDQQHVCLFGISRGDDAVGNLGETDHSFGFGGTGKFSTSRKFSDYGEKFGVGDTIVCAVDLESKPLASIGFSKNGKWLGTAVQFNAGSDGLGVVDSPIRTLQWESAIFPHILLKNMVVQLQFTVEDGLVLKEGFKPWAASLEDGNAIMGPMFSSVRDCEVMMMVGLPASGKSTWAEKWVKEHPEKHYVLLGTNLFLDQMKVPGLLRKRNYGERFDRLIGLANQMLNALLPRAAMIPRNYVIDQTNVYKSARKRKLRPFVNFRKIAVVVFPKPKELKLRTAKRFEEMGKEVPADAINDMTANYTLPGPDEFFDEVKFLEVDRREAQRYLDEMKLALRTASAPYSQENSVQSYNSRLHPNQWGSSAVAADCQPSMHSVESVPLVPPPLSYGYHMPNQVNSAYPGGFVANYQGCQNNPIPRAPTAYGPYPGSYSSIPGGGNGHYQISHTRQYIDGRNTAPGPVTNFSGASMVEPSLSGTAISSAYACYPPNGQISSFVHPHADLQASRPATALSSTNPSTHGYPYQAGTCPPPMYNSGGYTPFGPM